MYNGKLLYKFCIRIENYKLIRLKKNRWEFLIKGFLKYIKFLRQFSRDDLTMDVITC